MHKFSGQRSLACLTEDALADAKYVIALLCSLQSVAGNLTAATLPNLSATLRNMSTDYISVRPALVGILGQMQHINDTVILLPPAMQVGCAAA